MAKQERLVGVNGPMTPWQAGAGQQTEDRNADRALALKQQQMARRDAERQALMQGIMQIFQAQEARQAQASSQGFQSREAQAARTFAGGESLADRAMREREFLQGQKNADRQFAAGQEEFSEKKSQFDRGLGAEWAQAQLQAQGRGQEDAQKARSASATAALGFLNSEDIKSGLLEDDLAERFLQLQLLDPEAAQMVTTYMTSAPYKEVLEKSGRGAGFFEAMQVGPDGIRQDPRQAQTDRQRKTNTNLQKMFNLVSPPAASATAPAASGFLQRPTPAPSAAQSRVQRDAELVAQARAERAALQGPSAEVLALRMGDRTPQALDGLARSAEVRGRLSVRPSLNGQAGPQANLDRMVTDGGDMAMLRQQIMGVGDPLDHVPRNASPFPLMSGPGQQQHFGGQSLPKEDWRRPTTPPRRVR